MGKQHLVEDLAIYVQCGSLPKVEFFKERSIKAQNYLISEDIKKVTWGYKTVEFRGLFKVSFVGSEFFDLTKLKKAEYYD